MKNPTPVPFPLFDGNTLRYTALAANPDTRIDSVLQPLYKECESKGISVRELTHLVMLTATECEMLVILNKKPESKAGGDLHG